jgi:hypothetical protein
MCCPSQLIAMVDTRCAIRHRGPFPKTDGQLVGATGIATIEISSAREISYRNLPHVTEGRSQGAYARPPAYEERVLGLAKGRGIAVYEVRSKEVPAVVLLVT